jgi:hypothetical protein
MEIVDTNSKFFASFGFKNNPFPDITKKFQSSYDSKLFLREEQFFRENGIDVEAFKILMIKNDMQEYANHLLNYCYNETKRYIHKKERIEKKKVLSEYEEGLIGSLRFLLSNTDGKNLSITINKSRNSHKITDVNVINAVTKGLITEYETTKLNNYITIEEAENEIKMKKDIEWIRDWIKQYISIIDKSELESIDISDIDVFVCQKMIEDYSEFHQCLREIDLDFLTKSPSEFGVELDSDAGAKPKVEMVAKLAEQMSYLVRIDRFLNNQKGLTDIDEIKLTSQDCRFIYDCLAFFGQIDKLNKSPKPNYIRTLIDQLVIQWGHNPRTLINQIKNRL